MAEQIFISHSSQDNACVERLYNDLIDDRYWVWMDKKDLRGGEKWEPQIEGNLLRSSIFVAIFSLKSIGSEWVRHEGSIAYALNKRLITVNIEPSRSYVTKELPLWARSIHLMELYDGSDQYADQLELLKQRLGKPVPIRQHLLQSLEHYKRDKVLLDEVSLDLIEKYYDELHLVGSQKRIADELIQESKFKLESYWVRYNKLKQAYDTARTEELQQKQINSSLKSEISLRNALLVVIVIAFVVWLAIAMYFDYRSLLPFK